MDFRYCEDNGGELLIIEDEQMNDWVQTWLHNMGESVAYLGLVRDLEVEQEARAGSNCNLLSPKYLL